MKHRVSVGRNLIVWDDSTGRVTGNHPRLRYLREMLESPKPLEIGHYSGELILKAPETDPADFRALVDLTMTLPGEEFRYSKGLRDVVPTKWLSSGRGGCDEGHERGS